MGRLNMQGKEPCVSRHAAAFVHRLYGVGLLQNWPQGCCRAAAWLATESCVVYLPSTGWAGRPRQQSAGRSHPRSCCMPGLAGGLTHALDTAGPAQATRKGWRFPGMLRCRSRRLLIKHHWPGPEPARHRSSQAALPGESSWRSCMQCRPASRPPRAPPLPPPLGSAHVVAGPVEEVDPRPRRRGAALGDEVVLIHVHVAVATAASAGGQGAVQVHDPDGHLDRAGTDSGAKVACSHHSGCSACRQVWWPSRAPRGGSRLQPHGGLSACGGAEAARRAVTPRGSAGAGRRGAARLQGVCQRHQLHVVALLPHGVDALGAEGSHIQVAQALRQQGGGGCWARGQQPCVST